MTQDTSQHQWTFRDGKLRACARCGTQQHLVNDEWQPAAPAQCTGSA